MDEDNKKARHGETKRSVNLEDDAKENEAKRARHDAEFGEMDAPQIEDEDKLGPSSSPAPSSPGADDMSDGELAQRAAAVAAAGARPRAGQLLGLEVDADTGKRKGDYWVQENNAWVRVHVVPRRSLFTPCGTRGGVPM